MNSPSFSPLPALPSEEWFPKPLTTARKALDVTRKAVEAKRADVLAAVSKAREADLTDFRPARVDVVPALQSELVFRRSLAEYLGGVLTAANAYRDECFAEIAAAEEAVKAALLDMGYDHPVNGVTSRGTYPMDAVPRHPKVLAAKAKSDDVAAFVENHQAMRLENSRQTEALTAKLSSIRDAVAI